MKSMLKLSLVAIAFAMAIPFTQAQDNGTPPPPPPGEHGGQHKGGSHMDPLKFLTEKLSLTQDQQDKLKPILEERKKAMDAIREDSSLDKDAKKAKGLEVFKSFQPKIRAVLTPEQQKKYDELKEEMGPRGGPGGGQHKPQE